MGRTLYVTDLDGTLLGADGGLPDEHATRLRRLLDDGLTMTYATARSFLSASRVTAAAGFRFPAVVYGGALVVESGSGDVLARRTFAPVVVEEVLEICDRHHAPPMVYHLDGDTDLVSWVDGEESVGIAAYVAERMPDPRFRPMHRPLPRDDVFYLTVIGDESPVRRVAADVADALGTAVTTVVQRDIYRPRENWFEITAPGAEKGTAVLDLRERLGADRLVCFGDNLNDLPMFAVADHAVAMAHAEPEVLAAAHEVLGAEDSVVAWLERNV